MLFKAILAVYAKNHTKSTNTKYKSLITSRNVRNHKYKMQTFRLLKQTVHILTAGFNGLTGLNRV
jgi:hypothetical protein